MSDYTGLAKQVAQEHGLDPALVCAIVEQESAWNPWAIRYEPAFYSKYISALRGLTATEGCSRAISWGLVQLMGECARENGYTGALAALCDPQTGLEQGCIHFAKKLKAAAGDTAKALQLWNGGGNPQYSTQVLARVGKYR
jgi:soluble lytic murein transglycosylase-like protein